MKLKTSLKIQEQTTLEPGPKRHPKVIPICPDCLSHVVYYRRKTNDYVCRHCPKVGKPAEFLRRSA